MGSRVIGVLAGEDFPLDRLHIWARSADQIYAADSAANRLIPYGFEPIVVGDLDSVNHEILTPNLRIVRDPDENQTDCDKLLKLVQVDGHQGITLVGIEGDEVDHILSTWSSLVRTTLPVRVVMRKSIGYVLRPSDNLFVPDVTGRRVSMIPITPCEGASLKGVKWPIDATRIEPGGCLSVSNKGTGDLSASISSGVAVVFIESFANEEPFW